MTVTADGTASGTPDTAIVQLGVRTRAESANEALDLANQKATDLLAALDFGGVEKEDITTTNVFVYPQYGNDGRQITGYEAGNTVSVKIRDIENAGTIIDATAGVVGDEIVLEGVSFTIDDTGALREAAREDALTNAKTQAEQLATASGLSVGDIVSIVEGSVPQIPVFRRGDAGGGRRRGQRAAGARPAGAQPGRDRRLRARLLTLITVSRSWVAKSATQLRETSRGDPVGSGRWASSAAP